MTRTELTFNLNAAYGLDLDPSDLASDGEGGWMIDGMDPYEWCEAMTMD